MQCHSRDIRRLEELQSGLASAYNVLFKIELARRVSANAPIKPSIVTACDAGLKETIQRLQSAFAVTDSSSSRHTASGNLANDEDSARQDSVHEQLILDARADLIEESIGKMTETGLDLDLRHEIFDTESNELPADTSRTSSLSDLINRDVLLPLMNNSSGSRSLEDLSRPESGSPISAPFADVAQQTPHSPASPRPNASNSQSSMIIQCYQPPHAMISSGSRYHHDHNRARAISTLWNDQRWDLTKRLLANHMESMLMQDDRPALRRCHHLLGVINSITGYWGKAISEFLLALNCVHKPLDDPSCLDEGDCAAAYWLGDIYVMQKRREEAIMAYSIAARNPSLPQNRQHLFSWLISMELEAIHVNPDSLRQNEVSWTSDLDRVQNLADSPTSTESLDSIFNTQYLSRGFATACFSFHRRLHDYRLPQYRHKRLPRGSRYEVLKELHELLALSKPLDEPSINIQPEQLCNGSEWPAHYDPGFCLADPARLLVVDRCDILNALVTAPDDSARMQTSWSIGSPRKGQMTHKDPASLIRTVRTCLTTSGAEFREVFDIDGCRFLCGCEVKIKGCANLFYFTICVVKQVWGCRYYVKLSDIGRARVFESGNDWLEHSEQKWWTLIRNFIEN